MDIVPVLHADPAVRASLRRGFRGTSTRVVGCPTIHRVQRVFQTELVNAVVLDVHGGAFRSALELMESYPRIPMFSFSAFRPEDGRLVTACLAAGFRGILLTGIDEPIAGEFIAARSAGTERRALLADAPRRLRLTEPVQLAAWEEVLGRVGGAPSTADIARTLGMTREHLSREFAAGGAPNLKRAIDLVRIACAAHLLTNPGYTVAGISHILHFSSLSHFAVCVRRVTGGRPSALARLGLRGVLSRFLDGRTRSRAIP